MNKYEFKKCGNVTNQIVRKKFNKLLTKMGIKEVHQKNSKIVSVDEGSDEVRTYSRGVVQIDTPIGRGTGHLCQLHGVEMVMTNNHVWQTLDIARQSTVAANGAEIRIQPNQLFCTSQQLDFTVVFVDLSDDERNLVHIFDLSTCVAEHVNNEIVTPFLHRYGCGKEYSSGASHTLKKFQHVHDDAEMMDDDVTVDESYWFAYAASTEPGCSGSPIVNSNFELIGLHASGAEGGFNYAVKMTKIVQRLFARVVYPNCLNFIGFCSSISCSQHGLLQLHIRDGSDFCNVHTETNYLKCKNKKCLQYLTLKDALFGRGTASVIGYQSDLTRLGSQGAPHQLRNDSFLGYSFGLNWISLFVRTE